MQVDYGKYSLTVHLGPQDSKILVKALNRLKKKEDILAKLVKDISRLQKLQDEQWEKEAKLPSPTKEKSRYAKK